MWPVAEGTRVGRRVIVKTRVVCATLHAEQLHDEDVWRLTRSTLSRSKLRWTVFVEPLTARIAGYEIAPILAWLAENGHEVAMHVHHHLLLGEPGRTTGFVRGKPLSRDDVERCLSECHDYLTKRGHDPVGFVSGSWLVLDPIFEWLSAHGFVYDSTLRTYASAGPYTKLVPNAPCLSVRSIGTLLEVPTTAPLRQQLRAELLPPRRSLRVDDFCYDLYYMHDYDMLRGSKRAAALTLGFLQPRADIMTVGEFVEVLGFNKAKRPEAAGRWSSGDVLHAVSRRSDPVAGVDGQDRDAVATRGQGLRTTQRRTGVGVEEAGPDPLG
jgi:peptidoglycan/xylan/chitin deacetylase (PgdA/CDA1 family)